MLLGTRQLSCCGKQAAVWFQGKHLDSLFGLSVITYKIWYVSLHNVPVFYEFVFITYLLRMLCCNYFKPRDPKSSQRSQSETDVGGFVPAKLAMYKQLKKKGKKKTELHFCDCRSGRSSQLSKIQFSVCLFAFRESLVFLNYCESSGKQSFWELQNSRKGQGGLRAHLHPFETCVALRQKHTLSTLSLCVAVNRTESPTLAVLGKCLPVKFHHTCTYEGQAAAAVILQKK